MSTTRKIIYALLFATVATLITSCSSVSVAVYERQDRRLGVEITVRP